MNKYKVGDRVWWYGEKVVVETVYNESSVRIKSDSGSYFMLVDSLKPIITVRA